MSTPYYGQNPGYYTGQAASPYEAQYAPQYPNAYPSQADLDAHYAAYAQSYAQSYPQGTSYYQNTEAVSPYAPQNSLTSGWFAFSDPGYIKGLVLGAGLAYLLTNPNVQRAIVKGSVSLLAAVQGGFEEVKEQIQDIKCEMSMKHDEQNTTEK